MVDGTNSDASAAGASAPHAQVTATATTESPQTARPINNVGSGYSHSMVPGGLLVMSSTTRPTGRISPIIREAICSSRS